MSEFLTVKVIAAKLDVRQEAVLTLIRSGQLKAFSIALKPGGKPRWRISSDALKEFIDSRTFQPAAPRRRRRSKEKKIRKYF